MKLFIHNDLASTLFEGDNRPERAELLVSLEKALIENPQIYLINPEEGMKKLSTQINEQYTVTLAISDAGYEIAERLQSYTGKLGKIRTLHIERREVAKGTWKVISTIDKTIEEQLQGIRGKKIAIVDDTIYSGVTIKALLPYLQAFEKEDLHIFSLIALSDSLKFFKRYATVFPYISLEGKQEKDVSIIKASGLFMNGAIRTVDGQSYAFFHRPEWIEAWFPKNAKEIFLLCQLLYDLSIKKEGKQLTLKIPAIREALALLRAPIQTDILS
jgi:hypoxanthine phosphoribosyltransferase